jgi:ligand-binding sensor domain-containing protein/signal transduction histidine kinase
LVAVLWLIAPPVSAALPFTFRSWSTHDGLPENQVTALAQTRDGYLWVGTEDGLARFDGVRFVTFGLRDGLKSTRIRTLFEDRSGSLWIGTVAGGLSRLRGTQMETFGVAEGLVSNTVNQLLEDRSGRLWVAQTRGLVVWQEGKVAPLELPPELSQQSITSLLEDHNGTLWLSVFNQGLWQFRDGRFSRFTEPAMPPELNGSCHRLWEDRAGRVWVCAGFNKLFCREQQGWREYSVPLDSAFPMLRSLAEETDGTVWAGSIRNGLYFVHEGQLTRITARDGLSDSAVDALLVDREGNVWVGTIGGGLNCLTRHKVRGFGASAGLRYPVVRGVVEVAPGELWVGTRGDGLYHWQGGQYRRVQMPEPFASEVFVNALLQATDKSIWAATGHGIYRFVNGQMESHPDWSMIFENTANVALCEDRAGGMWAGATTTLWHLRDGKMQKQPNFAPQHTIIAIAQDRRGTVWVGTEGDGLYRIVGNAVTRYTEADGLGSSQVRVLHFDPDGTLWIGTASGGLTRLKDGRFFTLGVAKGLPDETVSQILEDDAGSLWVGGNRGIARIKKTEIEKLASGQIQSIFPTVLTTADGLPSEECTGTYSPAGLKLRSGELCFATLRGIALVDPSQTLPVSPPPDVWLEDLVINGERRELRPLANSSRATRGGALTQEWLPITLGPGQYRLEFNYTGLNFTAPKQIRFRYQLEGLDRSWVDAGNQRTANYNFIPPGSYRFRVIACNKDGVWNDSGASLALIVQPFFWQRPWFWAAVFLGAMGGVAAVIRSVERRKQQREQARLHAQHAIERERARIAKDIHDDLGATLSEIRMLSKFAQSPESPPERVREDIKQIAAKALGSTQALDEIVWAVDPKADTLEGFVNYACAYATQYLSLADVRCRLDLPNTLSARPLRAEVRYNLFLAFKETLTNIVKHAAATEVWIKVQCPGDALTVTVTDNGKGMRLSAVDHIAAPSGLPGQDGVANMQSRLASIGGRFELISAPGEGTTVRFEISFLPGEPA